MTTLEQLLSYTLIDLEGYKLRVADLVAATAVTFFSFVFFKLLLKILQKNLFTRPDMQEGKRYSIIQILRYSVSGLWAVFTMQSLGFDISLVWAGSAALLVGVGLGVQQTFNDWVSGIILLFEGSVEVGDVVDMKGLIGKVKSINLRTSEIETRECITIIVPNSKLIGDTVINWSHNKQFARFSVKVGVAYNSDALLVKGLLLEVAKEQSEVLEEPVPFVRLTGFGESCLEFELLFFSKEFIRIEDVKSGLRFLIEDKFRENGIRIPFPQRELWVKGWPEK